MKYSPSTGGFYLEALRYANLPTDCVTITEAQHAALITAQNLGKVIKPDSGGNPQAVDFTPSPAQVAAQLAAQAQTELTKSDVTMIRCIEHGVAIPAAWVTYRAELRQVINGTLTTMPTQPAYPAGS
jgi:hypothetical protein